MKGIAQFSLFVAVLSGLIFAAVGCDEKVEPGKIGKPANHQIIDPKADQLLKAMSDTLAGAKEFEFNAMQIYDKKTPSGMMVQVHCRNKIKMSRPGKLTVTSRSDRGCMNSWHSDGRLTLLNPIKNIYAQQPAAKNNSDMLDELVKKYDLVMPMADLLFPNVYDILIANVEYGEYMGKTTIGKTICHHLAFQQANIDWQIWIDAGEKPLPRKFIITQKNKKGIPRHMAIMRNWNLSPKFSDKTFKPVIPADATKVEMNTMFAAPKGEVK